MGTSNTNSGNSGSATPLLPSWLGDDVDAQISGDPAAATTRPPIPEPGVPNRYTAPRAAFSRFARSGGRDRANLGRAVAGYVRRSSGGGRGAAQRMGSSRRTGARLLGFLNDVVDRGISDALRSLNLDALAGRPLVEVFTGLADYLCPEGGNLDVGIARNAFFETVTDLAEAGVADLDNLSSDQVRTIFEMFLTYAIEGRILNEIGTRAIALPADTAAIDEVQAQLHDFIANGVADAVSRVGDRLQKLPQDQTLAIVDEVLERAFTVLAALGDEEASS